MDANDGLRVAIVGAGPAGFYTAEHLFKKCSGDVRIDMYDRLPTPFGLVRVGVAPDHQKIKSVTKIYEKIASTPGFRFYGGVDLGVDVTVDELGEHYHAVVLCVGAPNDRSMGIPGEDLPGSFSATDFVAWYNGHPDAVDLPVDLSVDSAVVVGNGNVAVDVARILVTQPDVLAGTDIAEHALETLRTSRIREVTMIGRRGPGQAAFTSKELRELGEIQGCTLVVDSSDVQDARSRLVEGDEDARRIIEALEGVAGRQPSGDDRVLRIRFLTSPTSVEGDGRVESVTTVTNELVTDEAGAVRAVATDATGAIPAGLVLRAVGYRGRPLAGLPFDEGRGTIPNDGGRVLDAPDGQVVPGRYVAGWIKRGPQGVIGTNKADAGETVEAILTDAAANHLTQPSADPDAIDRLVRERVRPIDWAGWRAIDQQEIADGAACGRPRVKIVDRERLNAIAYGD